MPRVSCASVSPDERVGLFLSLRPSYRPCAFCDVPAMREHDVCEEHRHHEGSFVACSVCRAPIDRILGSLATDLDRLCPAHEFRARAARWLRCHR